MSEQSNQTNPLYKLLGATLAGGIVIAMVAGLGVFGVSLLGSQFQFAPPEDKERPVPEVAEEGTDGETQPEPKPDPKPAEPADPVLAAGITTYNTLCTTCHGPDGKGMPNNMAPSISETEFINGPTERLAVIVLNGILFEQKYTGMMVPMKAALDDKQIAGVLTYIRSNFGNDASAITPEQIAWAREKHGSATVSPRRQDLEGITTDLPENP